MQVEQWWVRSGLKTWQTRQNLIKIPLFADVGSVVVESPVLGRFAWVGAHGVEVAVYDHDGEEVVDDEVDDGVGNPPCSGEHEGSVEEVQEDDPPDVEENEY